MRCRPSPQSSAGQRRGCFSCTFLRPSGFTYRRHLLILISTLSHHDPSGFRHFSLSGHSPGAYLLQWTPPPCLHPTVPCMLPHLGRRSRLFRSSLRGVVGVGWPCREAAAAVMAASVAGAEGVAAAPAAAAVVAASSWHAPQQLLALSKMLTLKMTGPGLSLLLATETAVAPQAASHPFVPLAF